MMVTERVTRTGPDGTERFVPNTNAGRGAQIFTTPHFPSQQPQRAIDAFFALQVGLWQMLSAQEMYSIDTEKLLAGAPTSRAFRFERIFFDWARQENDRVPNNSVAIQQAGATRYTDPYLDTVLLEDTIDVFCPGTILKRMHTAEVNINLVVWLSHKDDRGGVRRMLEDMFDDSEDERPGRRVLIKPYYNQIARYTLSEITYADTSDSATDNTWPLVATVACDIDVVKLVKRPGLARGVTTDVVIETLSPEELLESLGETMTDGDTPGSTGGTSGTSGTSGASDSALDPDTMRSGEILPSAFSGDPPRAVVTFSSPLPNANYTPLLSYESADSHDFVVSYLNRTPSGFTIELSATNLQGLTHVSYFVAPHL